MNTARCSVDSRLSNARQGLWVTTIGYRLPPHVYLTSRMWLQAIKNWRWERPGNEAGQTPPTTHRHTYSAADIAHIVNLLQSVLMFLLVNKLSPITKIWSRAKIVPGGPNLAESNGLSVCVCCVHGNVEATGLSNRWHREGVVYERGQQKSLETRGENSCMIQVFPVD